MPRDSTAIDTETQGNPWARGIAGWWVVLFMAGTVFAVVFDPPGFFPVFILTAAVTMPIFVIAAVIAARHVS